MHIAISTLGSRGDVQPLVALAISLRQAGHRVTLVTSRTFADWIQAYGVEVRPVDFNPQEILRHPDMQAFLKRGGNPLRVFAVMREGLGRAVGAHDELRAVDIIERRAADH